MFKNLIAALIATSALCAVNPAIAKKPVPLTPMEIQAIQSREFEVSKEDAFSSVMSVVQDLGYTISSADLPSGFITATSPNENKTNFGEALFLGSRSSGFTKLTCFMMQLPNGSTRIRLNFVNTKNTSSAYGQSSAKDKPILEPAVYQNAWERIDESLFVFASMKAAPKKVEPPLVTNEAPQ